jgi:hypothetical protein
VRADEVRELWAKFDGLYPAVAAFFKLRLMTARRAVSQSLHIDDASLMFGDSDLEVEGTTPWLESPDVVEIR